MHFKLPKKIIALLFAGENNTSKSTTSQQRQGWGLTLHKQVNYAAQKDDGDIEVRAANLLTLNGVEKLAGVQCAAHRACAGTTKLSIVDTMR